MIESSYSKLFASIVTSTIWQEDDATRLVWITLLALKNRNGEVAGSIPGLASIAKVSLAGCERALKRLSSPDQYSRTRDYAGRRIEAIDGGWRILNHFKYRDAMSEAERKASKAAWQKGYRERQKEAEKRGRDSGHVPSTWTHTDTDSEKKAPPHRQKMKPRKASPATCNHAANVHLCEDCAPDQQDFHDSGNPT